MGKVIYYRDLLDATDKQMAEIESLLQELQDELEASRDTVLKTGLSEDDLDTYEYLLNRWERLKRWAEVDEKVGDARRALEVAS